MLSNTEKNFLKIYTFPQSALQKCLNRCQYNNVISEIDLVEMKGGIGIDMPQDARICLLDHFSKMSNLHQHLDTTVREIGDHTVVVENHGVCSEIKDVDTVIVAVGSRENSKLAEEIKNFISEVYVTGDAECAKDLVKAIRQGYEAALKI